MLTANASDDTTPKVLSFMKTSSHSSAGLALAAPVIRRVAAGECRQAPTDIIFGKRQTDA
jgi:hypothetical protein